MVEVPQSPARWRWSNSPISAGPKILQGAGSGDLAQSEEGGHRHAPSPSSSWALSCLLSSANSRSRSVCNHGHTTPAPGRFVWDGPLANFTPGHQDTYVDFGNEERAPLLFIAGGEDNLMPPAVNQSNAKMYRNSSAVTDYHEFPGRSHYTVREDGWEEVADYALEWAEANATQPAA
jgi:pimeloyl-ACP methyl ester carboxylesterase